MLHEDDVAGLFPSDIIAVFHHIFADILVAHLRLYRFHTVPLAGLLQPQIGHNSRNNRVVGKLSALIPVFSADKHDFVAVYQLSVLVYGKTAVCISVVGETAVQMLFFYIFLQGLNVRRTALPVDVGSVRLIVNHKCLCAESVKHALGHRGGTAVGAVQTYTHVLEGTGGDGNQMTDIAVPPRRKINGAADIFPEGKRYLRNPLVDIGFDLSLHSRVHFSSGSGNYFYSVIVERIVAGGYHDPAVKLLGADNIGNAWRRRYVEQIRVRSGGRKPRRQRIFKHIAGPAGVLPDYNLSPALFSVVPAQKPAHLIGMFYRKPDICLSPKTICSKIFTHDFSSYNDTAAFLFLLKSLHMIT